MPNKWISALKQWNAEKGGSWCVPRKGSPDYDAVRALMGAPAKAAVPAKAVAAVKTIAKLREERRAAKQRENEDREGRNVARRQTALEQLRGVEAETKARNLKREEEGKAAAAEAAKKAAEAPKPKKVFIRPVRSWELPKPDPKEPTLTMSPPAPVAKASSLTLEKALPTPIKNLKVGSALKGRIGDYTYKVVAIRDGGLVFNVVRTTDDKQIPWLLRVQMGRDIFHPIELMLTHERTTLTIPTAYKGLYANADEYRKAQEFYIQHRTPKQQTTDDVLLAVENEPWFKRLLSGEFSRRDMIDVRHVIENPRAGDTTRDSYEYKTSDVADPIARLKRYYDNQVLGYERAEHIRKVNASAPLTTAEQKKRVKEALGNHIADVRFMEKTKKVIIKSYDKTGVPQQLKDKINALPLTYTVEYGRM